MFASSTKIILTRFLAINHFIVGLSGTTVSTHVLDVENR